MDFYRGLLTPDDEAIAKQEQAEDLLRFKKQPEEHSAPTEPAAPPPEESR
jgi:hypothetical protein